MSEHFTMDCGCSFPILGEGPLGSPLPLLDIDPYRFPLCKRTWELLASGRTKGIFQLESELGQKWTKRLKPRSTEHLAALVAILRPGALYAEDAEGVSMTEHYCRRANGEEEVKSFHPVVDRVLEKTYGNMLYQEQMLLLVKEVAGFTLSQADTLRKATGKKDPKVMQKVIGEFMEGVIKAKVISKEQGDELVKWIKESQAYLFGLSHSAGYGLTGHDCAYLKAHFPVAFYQSWLRYAWDKSDPMEEVRELVEDARQYGVDDKALGITLVAPDLSRKNPYCDTNGKEIFFGLLDIKGVGEAAIHEVLNAYTDDLADKPWYAVLAALHDKVGSKTMECLAEVGAFRRWGVTARKAMADILAWGELTDGEKGWLERKGPIYGGLAEALRAVGVSRKHSGGCHSPKRADKVQGLAKQLEETPTEEDPFLQTLKEEELLGISLTGNRIDGCDTSRATATLAEFKKGKCPSPLVFAVELTAVKPTTTKKGKHPGQAMGVVDIRDATESLKGLPVFPEAWASCGELLKKGGVALLHCKSDRGGTVQVINGWPLQRKC